MGKSGPKAPKAPDPYETASAESQFNRLDTYGPSGSGVRYGYTRPGGAGVPQIQTKTRKAPGSSTGRTHESGDGGSIYGSEGGGSTTYYTVNGQEFDSMDAARAFQSTFGDGSSEFVQGVAPPGYQSAVQTVESATDRALREMLEPASVDFTRRFISDNVTNMPDAPRVRDRSDVAQDIFDRNFSLMAPAIDQSQNRLLRNLQARGLPVGGDAFNDAYGRQLQETQDTISRLSQDANIAAGQEQSREFGLEAAARQNSMAELAAVMGGTYTAPNNVPSGSAPSVDYSGMVQQGYQNDLNAYNQAQQQRMSTFSTLGSLAGGLIKSARDAKDVRGPVRGAWAMKAVQSLPVAAWSYKPEHAPEGDTALHIGPMAGDFHAVTGLSSDQSISVIDMMGLLMAALQGALARVEVLERQARGEVVH